MKKIITLILTIIILQIIGCSQNDLKVQNIPTLVKEGFIGADQYEIVCIGFPKEGLTGIQKEESAKRAAILNAYFYTKSRFDETVSPDTDGTVKNMDISETHATVHYVIQKKDLKKRLKTK